MKKDVRIIFEDTAYRYMPNTSIENDVLDKVRSTIDNKEFAGNFYSSLWQGGGDGYLYELDDYDNYVVRKEKLKEGEKIYRYFTRNSAITGQVPLIKINIDKGLLYFLKPDDEDLDLIEFETKGIPVRYLNIILPKKEEYAEGGYVRPSYYILTFGFYGDEGYQIGTSKPIMAETEEDAMIEFVDQFESYEGIPVHVISVTKQMAEGGDINSKDSVSEFDYDLLKKDFDKIVASDLFEDVHLSKFDIQIIGGLQTITPYYDIYGKHYQTKRFGEYFEIQEVIEQLKKISGRNLAYKITKSIIPEDVEYDEWDFKPEGERMLFKLIPIPKKMAEGGELKEYMSSREDMWDAIKKKFDKIFWMEQDGDDEIFANEVKLEEPVYNWDGRPSPYTKRVSFSDAKSMFLRSLTDEEKAMIELEYDYKDVHELFGLMSEKKIIVKRKKDESKDFLSQLDEIDLSDPNLYMKNGGKLSRKNVLIQNSPINKSTNTKMKTSATLEGGVKKNMLFDKNGERRVDPEALEYIENTVEMLPQTKFMYTKENGEYTPERKKLHDEIIATFHEGKPCINKRPAVAILTGGAPASGKTTFIKKYVDLDPDKVYHVDADEVRAMLPEYKGWNATQTHLETADLVNQLIDEIGVPCDHDLIYDGTMNKATKYEKIVNKLHKLGYKVFVVYISIPEQVSKERVIARYKKAGRYVPMKVIEEVYDNGLTAFEKVAHEMADGYIRIDGMNGEIIEQGGMSMPSNIEYEKGGKIGDEKLKNGTALVRSAERFAEMETGKPVKKGRGIASASISDGKRKYKSVTVFFEDGSKTTFDEETFPKFFLKDGGELGGQDYYDGFQMQVVQKKGIPDKEAQKENIKMTYRKGGKL